MPQNVSVWIIEYLTAEREWIPINGHIYRDELEAKKDSINNERVSEYKRVESEQP